MTQLKGIVAQRVLQPLQPVDIAAAARRGLLARRINGHTTTTLLFRYITSAVGCGQQFIDGAALRPQLNESDADADLVNAIAPYVLVFGHRPRNIIGDLSRFFRRTSD